MKERFHNMQNNEITHVPLHLKYLLTIKEASEYFGIGERKLRELVTLDYVTGCIVNNGAKTLIKRIKFEQFIDETYKL